MTKCEYEEVETSENNCRNTDEDEEKSWTPFLRQFLICSAVWTTYFQCGLNVGTPTVLIPQLRRQTNSTNIISQEQASWLSSVSYITAHWLFILVPAASYFGRRATHAGVAAISLAAYVGLYFSTAFIEIFICLASLGILSGSVSTIGLLIVTEYTSPENRGFFLMIKAATFFWGVWTANAIGTFAHWKNIAVFGCCCGVYNALALLAWPESPYWLASKGRLEESRKAFLWLRGTSTRNELELEKLMGSKINLNSLLENIESTQAPGFWKSISSRSFYEPVLLCLLSFQQFQFTGKLVITVYSIDIIKKITSSERKAYIGMLTLDGVTVFGMYLGCFLSKRLPRRVQLIAGTSGGIVCLLLMSLYLYLVNCSLISENVYVSVSLLCVGSLFVCCGPVLLHSTLNGELLPLHYRSLAVAITAINASTNSAITVKLAPQLFAAIGMDGSFLFFGLVSICCLIGLYKYLPETKDKTLVEISEAILCR